MSVKQGGGGGEMVVCGHIRKKFVVFYGFLYAEADIDRFPLHNALYFYLQNLTDLDKK